MYIPPTPSIFEACPPAHAGCMGFSACVGCPNSPLCQPPSLPAHFLTVSLLLGPPPACLPPSENCSTHCLHRGPLLAVLPARSAAPPSHPAVCRVQQNEQISVSQAQEYVLCTARPVKWPNISARLPRAAPRWQQGPSLCRRHAALARRHAACPSSCQEGGSRRPRACPASCQVARPHCCLCPMLPVAAARSGSARPVLQG